MATWKCCCSSSWLLLLLLSLLLLPQGRFRVIRRRQRLNVFALPSHKTGRALCYRCLKIPHHSSLPAVAVFKELKMEMERWENDKGLWLTVTPFHLKITACLFPLFAFLHVNYITDIQCCVHPNLSWTKQQTEQEAYKKHCRNPIMMLLLLH